MLSFLIHRFQGEGGINAGDSLINLCMRPIFEWLVLLNSIKIIKKCRQTICLVY